MDLADLSCFELFEANDRDTASFNSFGLIRALDPILNF